MNVMETLLFYLSLPYVRYALAVGVMIALCSSLLGVTLVMKRLSFIGDGLSHVAFGAVAVSSSVEIMLKGLSDKGFALPSNMIIVLPVTLACAVLLLRIGQNSRIKGDAVIAMISGYALIEPLMQNPRREMLRCHHLMLSSAESSQTSLISCSFMSSSAV